MADPRQYSKFPSISSLTSKTANRIEIYCFNSRYPQWDTLRFPAFVTSFSDTYKSDWKEETVYGRMDPIATFKATSRTISLGFDIPNDSLMMAKENLKQLDYLIRGLYPVYDEGEKGTAILSSPPFFRVRFANLVRNISNQNDGYTLKSGLLCYIKNFAFNPKIENGFFIEQDKSLYPKLISVTLELNIIHEHPLGHKKNAANEIEPRVNFGNFPHGYDSAVAAPNPIGGTKPQEPPKDKKEEAKVQLAKTECTR